MPDSKVKEKEREAQLKALRQELEAQIEEDLQGMKIALGPRQEETPAPVTGGENLAPKRIIEALLFASSKPLRIAEIRKMIQGAAPKEIESLIAELREEYRREARSFELIEIADGYQIVTRKEYAQWLARLELEKKIRQASRSALETLAILAYKQPVTRAEIEELRGVDVSGVLSTLLEKNFIKIVGRKEVPGRPFLYGTTEKFLEHFGLKSITGLPPIGEIKHLIERTVKREELITDKEETPSQNGPETPPTEN